MAKAVRGRLHVSFHSAMGIPPLYASGLRGLAVPAPPTLQWGDGPGVDARQRPDRPRPGGPHRAAGLGVVLVQGRLARRGAGRHRRLALGRAHELQGHHQHSPRPGQGHHRALRRQLERLHLARSDDVPRDRHHRRPRPDAVHRGRTDGQLPLRPGRLRIGADGDHLRAAGRGERPRAAARHRDHGHRVQGPSLPASDHRLDPRPADDDPRRPLRALPPLLRAQQRDPGGGWRRRYRRRHAPRRARLRGHRPGRPGPAAHDRGAGAGRRAPGAPAQAGDDGLLAGRLPRPAIHRSRLLSAAGPRRHPHRRVGAEHLVGRAGADTPAGGASLQGPRQPRPGLVGRRVPGADCRAVPLLGERDRRQRPVDRRRRRGGAGRTGAHRRRRRDRRRARRGEAAAAGAVRLRRRQRDRCRSPNRLLRDHRPLAGLGRGAATAGGRDPRRRAPGGRRLFRRRQPHHRRLRADPGRSRRRYSDPAGGR